MSNKKKIMTGIITALFAVLFVYYIQLPLYPVWALSMVLCGGESSSQACTTFIIYIGILLYGLLGLIIGINQDLIKKIMDKGKNQ